MSYPLTEKDVPAESDVVYCVICGHRGYKDSTMMMRITSQYGATAPVWVHTDICWNKYHLQKVEE